MMENRKISLSPEVLSQEIDGETVLLDLASEQYFGLDAVGTRVWQLLQEGNDLVAVYEAMLKEYDVDAARLESDLRGIIGKLADAGLISNAPPEQ